jgi:GLPGLI family protein
MDSDDKKEDEKEEKEPEMEERTITAWYTPQIPVNNGPAMYQGLPGLILEVHDGKLTIICSKIVLNPEDKVKIEEPTKGKVVNQKNYDGILEKKNKEMMERYAPRKGREGESISITIGG